MLDGSLASGSLRFFRVDPKGGVAVFAQSSPLKSCTVHEHLLLLLHVALACREGTTIGLFITNVIRLTVGNSGIAAGNTSCSSIVSSSVFVRSKLFVHAGILKTSLVFLAVDPEVEHYKLWVLYFPKGYSFTHSR